MRRSPATGPGPGREGNARAPVTAVRWGAIAVGLALAVTSWQEARANLAVGAGVLVAYAAWRSVRPLAYGVRQGGFVGVLVEVALHIAVVVATGYWDSPYVFSLITAILAIGFAGGFAVALRASLTATVAVAVPYHLSSAESVSLTVGRTAQWGAELVLVALVAGYARSIVGEVEQRHSLALDRLGQLTEANTLLSSLHDLTQALPASLDLDEVLSSTTARLRSFFDLTALAVLLADETSTSWIVVRQEGARLPAFLGPAELPRTVLEASTATATTSHPALSDEDRDAAVVAGSGSGLYAPLLARGRLVGVLAVEHDEADHFSDADVRLLDGFTEAAALAIDNARLFSRLRSVGADEERNRIARELHDRVGQSMAYLAFEMDRLVGHCADDELRPGMVTLRGDLRRAIGEIRETLYDLRSDVSELQGWVETVEQFLDRVAARSGLEVALDHDRGERLPLPREREMWRLAQEAITNAERHSHGTLIRLRWRCDGVKATLEVADNGDGFDAGKAGRLDSYGILGMRERAAAIGALLTVDSAPGRGTTVRCVLDPDQ